MRPCVVQQNGDIFVQQQLFKFNEHISELFVGHAAFNKNDMNEAKLGAYGQTKCEVSPALAVSNAHSSLSNSRTTLSPCGPDIASKFVNKHEVLLHTLVH